MAKKLGDIRKAKIVWSVFLALGMFFLPAGGPGSAPGASAADKDNAAIDFFDSGAFDRKLSGALRKDLPEVRVKFPAKVTVNSIPKRMDKWLASVEKYGGTVELKVDEEYSTRGIFGVVIDLILGAYELAREKILYGPSENYNATVYYMKGDGTITKVVFTRKGGGGSG